MNLTDKINILEKLGQNIKSSDLENLYERAAMKNPWFTKDNIKMAVESIVDHFLQKKLLESWLSNYSSDKKYPAKKIGLVLAGNIPMVGFHDILCVFLAGHISMIKYSEKDDILIPYFLKVLTDIEPQAEKYFERVDKISGYDAVIATGSNNSAKYFSYYFKNVPHIIRKNRNAVGMLSGTENAVELDALARDIFMYFGLGCRNVSKIFVPEGYDFHPLMSAFDQWKHLEFHHKYKNNLEYNHALYLLNQHPFMMHEALLLIESDEISSRVGCLHYEFYTNPIELAEKLLTQQDDIQCIIGHEDYIPGLKMIPFGKSQSPDISTYADGIDTMEFLTNLHVHALYHE